MVDTAEAVRFYVDRMLSTGDHNGMKVLLFDDETLKMMGLVYSRHLILERGVFLHDYLSSTTRKKMSFLFAVVFVRPTAENLELLKKELQNPKYKKYRIYFSNSISEAQLRDLASADANEVVESVQEFFADFYAVDPHLFTFNLSHSLPLTIKDSSVTRAEVLERSVTGVVGAFLALKLAPVVRYTHGSSCSREFATAVQKLVSLESAKPDNIFHKRPTAQLLVLDRKDDPVTPLLTQWHYQAMVHELIGIDLNRVDLSGAPDMKLDEKEVVLAQNDDAFFQKNMFANFGDLGGAVKALMSNFQRQHQSTKDLKSGSSTVEDIQKIVDNFPELRKNSNDVAKHVTLMSELARLVESKALMKISALEQDLCCGDGHNAHAERVQELLQVGDSALRMSLLRVVLLYALRYESNKGNKLAKFCTMLQQLGLEDEHVDLVQKILRYAGESSRTSDIYGTKSVFNKLGNQITREFKGVENVYTQHNPLLKSTLDNLLKGKLKESEFPFIGSTEATSRNIIVYIVGGFTYEESMVARQISDASGIPIILGGSCIHNSSSFIKELVGLDV